MTINDSILKSIFAFLSKPFDTPRKFFINYQYLKINDSKKKVKNMNKDQYHKSYKYNIETNTDRLETTEVGAGA